MAYRVETSSVLLARIQELKTEANAAGQGNTFNAGLKDLHSRIAANPFTAGELKYHTPMGYPVYSAGSGPAVVSYVVYESRQTACVIKVDRLDPPPGTHLNN